MNKNVLGVVLSLVMSAVVAVTCITFDWEDTKQPPKKTEIKNVIVLIPDGGGYDSFDFANDVKTAGGFKEPNEYGTQVDASDMYMKNYLAGSATTLNYDGNITDSAAAGTAIATGVKTKNSFLGVDHNKRPVATLLEAAQEKGKATGLVSTYEWMHATPAAFSSHCINRNDYDNIYKQIENQNIDVVLGWGYGAVKGKATIQNAIDAGYKIVKTKEDFSSVVPGERLWADSNYENSPFDIDLSKDDPTLAELTSAAITALSKDEDGFFLMVEGSRIDTGGHANNTIQITSEYLAFDAAFEVAVEFAKGREDTVVIAIPDHDTGGLMYDEISNKYQAAAMARRGIDSDDVEWESTGHTARNVGVWMYTPKGIDVIKGLNWEKGDNETTRDRFVIDNTDVAPYVANLFGVDLNDLTKQLFVDVTDIGVYDSETGKFTFDEGDRYVYKNESCYYKDGKKVDLEGRVAVEAFGKFYVPKQVLNEEEKKAYLSDDGKILGQGTKQNPYIINGAETFLTFTQMMIEGETFEGKYIKQINDVDMSSVSQYKGVGKNQTFKGFYDGCGNRLNVDFSTASDGCIFPNVEGKIINVYAAGQIKNTGKDENSLTGGIALCLKEGGRIINCISDVTVDGYTVGGIAAVNHGIIGNCFVSGELFAKNYSKAISDESEVGEFYNTYFFESNDLTQGSAGVDVLYDKTDVMYCLMEGLEKSAELLGITESELCSFAVSDDYELEMYYPQAEITKIVVTPAELTMSKGETAQISVKVEGKNNPSNEVSFSIEQMDISSTTSINEDGVIHIGKDETNTSLTVLVKSKADGSKAASCKVTIK